MKTRGCEENFGHVPGHGLRILGHDKIVCPENVIPRDHLFFRKKGLSLVEILVVLMILGILAGSVVLGSRSSWLRRSSPEGALRQAERFRLWLGRKVVEARLRNEEFVLFLPSFLPRGSLRLSWGSRNVSEIWEGEGYFFTSPGVTTSRFALPLGTFTPAFTLNVHREKHYSSSPLAEVVVSLYGRMTLGKRFP